MLTHHHLLSIPHFPFFLKTRILLFSICLLAFLSPALTQTVSFLPQRGFFDAPFSLTLTPGAGETIRYTTDGSAPTTTIGTIYTQPINVTTTSVIRAISYTSTSASAVVTHSYFFPADIVRQPATISGWPNNSYNLVGGNTTGPYGIHDYQMDPNVVNNVAYSNDIINGLKEIPTLSVVMNKDDFWAMNDGDAEFPTSVEIIYPNNPAANEHFNCGIEGHSHYRLKRSMRLVIKDAYFPTGLNSNIFRNAPLNGNFAKTNFTRAKIILRAGNDRSWASIIFPDRTCYTRDEFYRQSQIDISAAGTPGTFMHLYINGIYWGLYNPVQRPDAGYSAQYFGGTYADWMSVEPDGIRSGDPARFNYMVGPLKDKNMSVPANYAELNQYLDVKNFADYLILTWMIGMTDWPYNNFQGGNRNNPVSTHKYYGWDAEFSLDDQRDVNNGAWVHPDFLNNATAANDIGRLWHSVRMNSDFMMMFADQVYKHCFNDGKLTDVASRQRWQTINNFISKAIIAESARWGDATGQGITRTKNDYWQPEVNRVDGVLNGNVQRFITALRAQGYYPSGNPPVFSRAGGITTPGTLLTLTNPNGAGTIYYTTNGSDPRLPGGGLSPSALIYSTTAITLTDNITVKARILNGSSWSAMHEAAYFVPTLKINEFLASNTKTITDELGVYEDWIEIYNNGNQPVNIGGMFITDNLTNLTLYQIPTTNAALTTIPAKGHILLWADNEIAQGPLHVGIKLSGSGEAIGLSYLDNGTPVLLDSYTFGPQVADISVGRYPDGGVDFITFRTPTPGTTNVLSKTSGLYVNEFMTGNTSGITDENGAFHDWIEIYNSNTSAVDIGGMYLSNDQANPILFQIPKTNPALTTIPANGFIRLWADNQPATGILHLGFVLNSASGSISLTEVTGNENNLIDAITYTAQNDNISTGRYPDGSINTKLYTSPTPGAANILPLISGLFINEFLASNGTGTTDENGEFDDWFELYNATDQPIDIGGLFVTDNSANPRKWQIPTNNPAVTTIPPFGFKLLWADEQTNQGPLHTNIKLSGSGEQIAIVQINGTVVNVIDLITFGAQTTDITSGRNPDGNSIVQVLTQPTPGLSNIIAPNILPVANAGGDKSITLPVSSTTLDGSGTDDGTISAYVWTQVSGPNTAVFSSNAIAVPTVSGLVEGTYVFSLTVTDNLNATSIADEVTVIVNPDPNPAPTANAGGDKSITLPVSSTTLDGSGIDDGTITAYAWTQTSGPNTAVFNNNAIAVPTVSGLVAGTYVFSLVVTDNLNKPSIADAVTVIVLPAPNLPPSANAGGDKSITLPVSSTTLDGSGTDDVSISSYAWTQFSGPNTANFSNNTIAVPTVSGLVAGTYIFSLTVKDNLNVASAADQVTVIVLPAPNLPPTANAGPDKSITLPVNSTTLNGSGTDDGTISGYAWTQFSGPNTAVFSSSAEAVPTVSGLIAGTYVFNLTVTDNQNVTSTADQVTVTVLLNTETIVGGYSFETGFNGWTPGSTATNSNSKHIINAANAYEGSGSVLIQSRGATARATSPQLNLTGYRQVEVSFYFKAISMESGEDFWLRYSSNNGSTWATVATFVSGTSFANGSFYKATVTMNAGTFNTTGRFRMQNDAGDVGDQVYFDSVTIKGRPAASGTVTIVSVSAATKVNIAPLANAGADKSVTLPGNLTTLNGTGTDTDGTISAYSWTQISGPNSAAFNSRTVAVPTISGLVPGIYVFGLTVTDNQGATSSVDQVTITVNPDIIAPVVTTTSPLNNATGISTGTNITAVFSESLDVTSVNASTILLTAGATVIPVNISYTAGSLSVAVTPLSALTANTVYTVTLKGGASGIKDMSGIALLNDYTWNFTTAVLDQLAPVSVIISPLNNATVTVSQALTISGTSSDAGGINRVEVSVNGGISWQTASGTTNWSYSWTPTATGAVIIKSRAVDLAGNVEVAGTAPAQNAVTINVANAPSGCPCTIFTTQLPQIANQRDNTTGIVVGTRFRSNTNGTVTAIRFYKGVGNTGTHIGQLWTSGGSLLAQATFTNETASGWQQVILNTPVAITAGTTYIVSYHSSQGYYSVTGNFFANSVVNGPLTAPADATGANNGVYVYSGTPAFPNLTWDKENYYVDVVLNTVVTPDVTPPAVLSTSPVNNATGVGTGAGITAVFSEALTAASVSATTVFVNNGVLSVPAVVSYTAGSQNVVITPSSPLSANTVYTVTLKGGTTGIKDLANIAMVNDYTWSFTTAAADNTAPVSTITSPLNSATLGLNQLVTVRGTASDASGINRVEVSVNGGSSWQAATGTTSWTFNWTPTAAGSVVIKSRAVDQAGLTETAGTAPSANAINVTVSSVVSNPCPCTIFSTTQPIQPTGSTLKNDGNALSIGTKFSVSSNGYITALRFYKASGNTGTHTGQLFTASGSLLAQAVFTGETASGWQQINLATPVAVTTGTVYVVSYHSSAGNYSTTINYFNTAVVNGPLRGLANGENGGNGLYRYTTTPLIPNATYQASNYWVDVVFNTEIPPISNIALSGRNFPGTLLLTNQGQDPAKNKLAFLLAQNAPNPASGNTMIRFVLPVKTQVSIVLFDVQGKQVRVLVDDIKDIGEHRLEVDTRNLGKGVYYYKMSAGGFYGVKRLVVE